MDGLKILETNLARAGIPSRVTRDPLLRNVTGRIVQMDISRAKGKEELRISVPEKDEAEVKVLGIDREVQQAVLLVHEPEREFVERVWNFRKLVFDEVVQKTSEAKRRFLVGMDECHLFIAQLTAPATSVKQAHEGLRPRAVPAGRAARKLKIVRQGEWFFQPASEVELRELEGRAGTFGIDRYVRIGRARGAMRGRPHVVSESVLLPVSSERARGAPAAREVVEFVRGRVKHPDHHVLELDGWHKVFLNTEDRQALARVSSWVD